MAATPTARNLGAQRRDLLLAALAVHGRIVASEAAEQLGVSLDTVRRDLQELETAGHLRRVHGGALPPGPPGPATLEERLADDRPARDAVAAAAVPLVRTGDVVAITGGTTALAFARALPVDLDATVLTTSPDIAVALAGRPRLAIDLVGGRLEPRSRTVTGAAALEAVRTVCADVCVLSACSVHPARGLTLRDRDEADVVRAVAGQATRVVALADAAKLGTAAPYVVATVDDVDVLVTDAGDDAVAPYRDAGVEVVRA